MNADLILEWLTTGIQSVKNNGVGGISDFFLPVYKKALHQTYPLSGGEAIYSRDWEIMIIIDACRYDLLQSVEDEYGYLSSVDSFRSLESATRHWMEENFVKRRPAAMKDTAYICGNPFSEDVLEEDDFDILDEAWRYGWDSELGTLPPRVITDRVIDIHRKRNPDKIIAHYMQPHCPFVSDGEAKNKKEAHNWGEQTTDIWHQLAQGGIKKEEVWSDYRENLRLVLDEIEILLNNVDSSSVIVSSDRGNALGEWKLYGHPAHMPFDCLRTVPWCETQATDTHNHSPDKYTDSIDDISTEERLKSLGYM